jgi:hypothetical protein
MMISERERKEANHRRLIKRELRKLDLPFDPGISTENLDKLARALRLTPAHAPKKTKVEVASVAIFHQGSRLYLVGFDRQTNSALVSYDRDKARIWKFSSAEKVAKAHEALAAISHKYRFIQ